MNSTLVEDKNLQIDNWLQAIAALQQQLIISAGQRLEVMLLLRKPYGESDWVSVNELPLVDYPVALISQFITIAKRIDDWPLVNACCQAHPQLADQQYLPRPSPVSSHLRADSIALRPLHRDDLNSYFWQYSQDIADLCKLPDFDGDRDDSWHEWLFDCQQQSCAHLFAIEHQDWGFVGTVGIDVVAGRGFVYYWVGADFRGLGIGPDAVKLVLGWASSELNLRSCYAVTYEDNFASQKALTKLGFGSTGLVIDDRDDEEQDEGEEYEQELVFYLGPEQTDQALLLDINRLFVDIGSELVARLLGSNSKSFGYNISVSYA